MRAPAFWDRAEPSLAARLLAPAALAYGAAAAARMRGGGARAAVPVLCIGNFTVGGAGKTPTALRVAEILHEAGETPAFLSRGYGGRTAGPVRVDPARHTAAEVGDEPLLLARAGLAIVSRHRPAGARLAAAEGATVVIMDDGLQNPSLTKDVSLAVVDGAAGVGNGLVFPAGPLRAPLWAQWPRVDAVAVMGGGGAGEAVAREAERHGKPLFRGRLEPDPAVAARLRGTPVLAFCGIGRPQKFYDTLAQCGASLVTRRAFPDHHVFGAAEIRALRSEAEAGRLVPVTTEKDFARLQSDPALAAMLDGVVVLPVRAAFDGEMRLRALLAAALTRARAR